MNKKLVAVAIAGLLAAPLAQAQTANVTLYGRVHMDFEFVNGRYINPYPGIVQPASCTSGPNAGSVNGCITTNPTQFRVSISKNIWNCFSKEGLHISKKILHAIKKHIIIVLPENLNYYKSLKFSLI